MNVTNFLQWAQTAPTALRVEGADALARAYLHSDLEPAQRRDVETALASLLDDPSPLVRRALAKVFASSPDAPHSIVSALANDQSDIAAMVLSRSPLLTESELIDCAAIGDVFSQSAIALRAHVPTGLASAIAEIGACEAAISLAVNPGAELPAFAMRRMIERFGDDAQLREALLGRPFLPPSVRVDLVEATAASLASFVLDHEWLSPERMSRIVQESRDKANVVIAATAADEEDGRHGVRMLVAHLRRKGRLTPSLVLRALLSGNRALMEAALAELSGVDEAKVAGFVRDFRGAGFAALYARADMPANLLPAYRAALEAQRAFGYAGAQAGARLSLAMVKRVLASCDEINSGELDRLMALLRRFEAEALRDDARDAAASLAGAPQLVDMSALEAELLVAA